MKFVSSIDEETERGLKIIENSATVSIRARNRAKAIRLSSEGYKINDLATICNTCRDTISKWIYNWESDRFDSLVDAPRSGRNPIIDPSDHDLIIDIVKKEPRQVKKALHEIKEKLGKSISRDTLKRILKKKTFSGAE